MKTSRLALLISLLFLTISDSSLAKGPIVFLKDKRNAWFTAYEQGSQDNKKGLETYKTKSNTKSNISLDAAQGVEGKFHFEEQDNDFTFVGIKMGLWLFTYANYPHNP